MSMTDAIGNEELFLVSLTSPHGKRIRIQFHVFKTIVEVDSTLHPPFPFVKKSKPLSAVNSVAVLANEAEC